MADAPPVSAPPAAAGPDAAGDDPFLRLHKMSITAGLGSGDYVAISGLSIAAVLLGVGSLLVLFHVHLLLLVPLAGLVCGVLAFVQIGRSNGTLTGRGLALLGLVLSLGLGGYEGSQVVIAWQKARADQTQVIDLIHRLGDDVVAGNYQDAYDLCDPDLRSYVTRPVFEGVWQNVRHSALLGTMIGLDWNGQLTFENDPLTNQRVAGGMVFIKFNSSPEPVRTDMVFRAGDHGWRVSRIPQFFVPPGQQQAAPGPSGPKGPSAPAGKPQTFGPPRPS